MSGEVSPVKAPLSSACIVWAPMATFPASEEPPTAAATAASQIVGGQTTVRTCSPAVRSRTDNASLVAASCVGGFIFQLPATSGIRGAGTSAPCRFG